MTNYKTILILISVLFLSGSCKNSQNTKTVAKAHVAAKSKTTSLQTIDVDNNLDNKKVVKLSDIAEKIEYVRLGGSEKYPLGYIMSYSITDDFIFIRAAGTPVYKFDRKGKFIKQFGRVGKGPGEFCKYASFSTDNKNRLLCLYDHNKRKFITYNFEGKYLYSVNAYHGTSEEFTLLNKKPILSYGISYGIQRYRLTTYNKDGEIIDSLMNPDTFKKRERTMVLGTNFDFYMQKYGNSVIYKGEYSDIAYSVNSEGKISKKYFINQGEIIPLEKRIEYIGEYNKFLRNSGKYYRTKIIECSDNIFITTCHYTKRPEISYGMCNKKDFKPHFFVDKEGEDSRIINDIDGGDNFYPTFTVGSKVVADCIQAHKFKNRLKDRKSTVDPIDKEASANFKKMYNDIKVGDNPIFVIVTLK